jgi:hypothetical protein
MKILGFGIHLDTSISRPLFGHLEAVARRNITLLRESFTSDALFVGTDDTEQWTLGQLERALLESTEGWTMRHTEEGFTIRAVGDRIDMGTFYEVVVHEKLGTMRGSGTIIKDEDGKWKIAQYVLSFSVPNEVVDETNLLELLGSSLS